MSWILPKIEFKLTEKFKESIQAKNINGYIIVKDRGYTDYHKEYTGLRETMSKCLDCWVEGSYCSGIGGLCKKLG